MAKLLDSGVEPEIILKGTGSQRLQLDLLTYPSSEGLLKCGQIYL